MYTRTHEVLTVPALPDEGYWLTLGSLDAVV